jgi:hypothetical protein
MTTWGQLGGAYAEEQCYCPFCDAKQPEYWENIVGARFADSGEKIVSSFDDLESIIIHRECSSCHGLMWCHYPRRAVNDLAEICLAWPEE